MRNLKRVLSLALALVMMLGMMIIGANAASTKDFTDVGEIKYTEAVEVLTGLGVLEGYDTGDFQPNTILTREQAAKILCYIMLGKDNAEKLGKNTEIFKDVPAGHWSAGFIAYCANVGLIAGNGDGTFDPTGELTGVAFAKLLLVAAGYNAEAEGYVNNKDWATNIAVDAIDAGIDVKGVVLSDALTREQAAQMVLQALEMDTVTYRKGTVIGLIGPYTVARTSGTDYRGGAEAATDGTQQFCEKYFAKLTKTAGGNDIWGRPVDHTWLYNSKAISTIYAEALATYTNKATVCGVAADLGLTGTAYAAIITDGTHVANVNLTTTAHVTTPVSGTGTGVLTQVYANPSYGVAGAAYNTHKYLIVEVNTYLAKVGAVTPSRVDVNGHVTDPSTALTVYVTDATGTAGTYKTADYTTGTYVLVTRTAADGVVRSIAAATPVVGALTGYNTVTKTSVLGGATYNWAEKYFVGNTGNMHTTYNVYTDNYGNVIGLVPTSTVYSYGIITDIAWANSYNPLDDAKVYANLKNFANEDTTGTVLAGKLNGNTVTPFTSNDNGMGDYATGKVSTIKANNGDYYNTAFKFTTVNGKQVITAVGTRQNGTNITNSIPNVMATTNAATNDNTVYLVKTGSAAAGYTYTVYTGYRTIPTMTNVNISYFYENGYVTYAYVDASSATFTGTTEVAYITSGTNVGVVDGKYAYYVYIDGVSTLKTSASNTLTGWTAADLYTISYDANGNIVRVDTYTPTSVANVAYYDGTVITDNAGTSYNCAGAGLYKINVSVSTGAVSVASGSAAELTAGGVTAYLVMNTAGTQATAIYYVVAVA